MCVCEHILSHMHTCALRCLVPFSVAGVEKQKWHHVGVFERMLKRHPLFSLSCSGFKQAFGLCRKHWANFSYWFSIQIVKLLNTLSSLNNIGLSKNEGCPKMMDAKKSSFNGKVMIHRWSTIKFRSHLLNLGLGHQKQRRLGAGSIHPVGNHPCSLATTLAAWALELLSESFLSLYHLSISIRHGGAWLPRPLWETRSPRPCRRGMGDSCADWRFTRLLDFVCTSWGFLAWQPPNRKGFEVDCWCSCMIQWWAEQKQTCYRQPASCTGRSLTDRPGRRSWSHGVLLQLEELENVETFPEAFNSLKMLARFCCWYSLQEPQASLGHPRSYFWIWHDMTLTVCHAWAIMSRWESLNRSLCELRVGVLQCFSLEPSTVSCRPWVSWETLKCDRGGIVRLSCRCSVRRVRPRSCWPSCRHWRV